MWSSALDGRRSARPGRWGGRLHRTTPRRARPVRPQRGDRTALPLSQPVSGVLLGDPSRFNIAICRSFIRAGCRSRQKRGFRRTLSIVSSECWMARARLPVPTLPAFAAAKTATWHDRRASRDLWDLWALSTIGGIDSAAGELHRRLGPTNRLPGPHLFDRPPHADDWNSQLAGQTRLTITADTALTVVREAWATVSQRGWAPGLR